MVDKQKTLLDKYIRDRNGKLALAERPNLPLVVWALARLLAWPLKGSAEHFVGLVGTAALLLWATLELFQGVNYFRRTLGLVVLSGLLFSLAR